MPPLQAIIFVKYDMKIFDQSPIHDQCRTLFVNLVMRDRVVP